VFFCYHERRAVKYLVLGSGDVDRSICTLHLCPPLTCISLRLNDKRVTATSMPPSIVFSFNPFANIWSAILKLHAITFATQEKAHYAAIDYANVFQVQNDFAAVRLKFKKSPQLGYRLCFDSPTWDEYCESPWRRSLHPKSHRVGHIAVAAVPHSVPSIRAPITSRAIECQLDFTENRARIWN
jgi:hypothetical protein